MNKLEEIQKLITEYNDSEETIIGIELCFVPRRKKRPVTEMNNIITAFCNIVGVSIKEVISSCRKRPLPDYRSMLAFFLRDAGFTLLEIAGALGWADHSTALSACVRHEKLLMYDKTYRKIYEKFLINLHNGKDAQVGAKRVGREKKTTHSAL